MEQPILFGMAVVLGLAFSGNAQECQPRSEVRAVVQNLSFSQGVPGSSPPGWFFGPKLLKPPHAPVFEAKIVPGESCNGSQQCATVNLISQNASITRRSLYQVIDASQYRGKWLTFRADVRKDVSLGSAARLLVRVRRNDCSTTFEDDMGNYPIASSTWSPYVIRAPIASDARDIDFGIQLSGQGAAWIDNISMTCTDTPYPEELRVRALIKTFDDARNRHDGIAVAALYSEDGEWISNRGNAVHGWQALATMWGGLSGQVEPTIQSVDFPGGDIALVRLTLQYSEPTGQHHEIFILLNEQGKWNVRVHQAVD
jgi:uncharacterized protein (TIGR02246 family)